MHVFWALAVASIINGKIYQPCKQFWILQNYDLKLDVGLYAVLDDMRAAKFGNDIEFKYKYFKNN